MEGLKQTDAVTRIREIKVAIRPMIPGDVSTVGEILAASPEAAQWDLRLFVNARWPEMGIWVAEDGDRIIGIVAARTAGGEAEILNLAVTPRARRRGIARQLVEEALHTARSAAAECVFLEVRESNAAARAFYSALGFSESKRRTRYYRDPVEDALVLSLKLT